jgi:hypothetical protein
MPEKHAQDNDAREKAERQDRNRPFGRQAASSRFLRIPVSVFPRFWVALFAAGVFTSLL